MDETAVIELHDVALRCRVGSHFVEAPGHALITPRGIVTGAEAQARAWLEPQHSFDQYWQQLGVTPLPTGGRHARHFADLAHAQLLDLHCAAGRPAQVIFAVPGYLTRDQLAVLLGIAHAAPFRIAGLIDAALAATAYSTLSGDILHLDLLRHCTLLTSLHAGAEIERREVRVLPEIGLNLLHERWARHIAERFIASHRYDPLHTGAGEQALRNALPGWLTALGTRPEIHARLQGPRGPLQIALTAAELTERAAPLYAALDSALANFDNATRLLTPSLALLPDMVHRIPGRTLAPEAVGAGCLTYLPHIAARPTNVLITRLPAPEVAQRTVTAPTQPTHVLWRHRAHALGTGLVIRRHQDALFLHPPASEPSPDAATEVRLTRVAGKLVLTGKATGLEVEVDGDATDLRVGDRLRIGEEVLELIEVL